MMSEHHLDSIEALEAHYGAANPRSILKEIDYIRKEYAAFIENAPFVIVATSGPGGLDCSPRGDPAGFCVIEDNRTVLIPDRKGNNRLDSLRNLVVDPRISLLFLIPGVGETMRINGSAEIRTDPELLARFELKGTLPKAVLRISVDRVYFQCQKALRRSRLWSAEAQVDRKSLPSAGEMLRHVDSNFDAEQYDRDYPEHMKRTLY